MSTSDGDSDEDSEESVVEELNEVEVSKPKLMEKKFCKRLIIVGIFVAILVWMIIVLVILFEENKRAVEKKKTANSDQSTRDHNSSDSDSDSSSPEDFCKNVKIQPILPLVGHKCPEWKKNGSDPRVSPEFPKASDPQHRTRSPVECWFSKEVFNTLFPMANQGWGPKVNRPYTYEAFVIATRYFPKFANEHVTKDPTGKPIENQYMEEEIVKRDLAAFFAHSFTISGLNQNNCPDVEADYECYMRSGLYYWYDPLYPSEEVEGADQCQDKKFANCEEKFNLPWLFPCSKSVCYHARGPMGIHGSDYYYYFMKWLKAQKITHDGKDINLMESPHLVVTKMDPPLAWISALWFYMNPSIWNKMPRQTVPSLHDIIIGNWVTNQELYHGSVFGPTELVMRENCNDHCKVEKKDYPPTSTQVFDWLCNTFNVRATRTIKDETTLVCDDMETKSFDLEGKLKKPSISWEWDGLAKKTAECDCKQSSDPGPIPAYDVGNFPRFGDFNYANKKWCESIIRLQFEDRGKQCQKTTWKSKQKQKLEMDWNNHNF